MKKIFLTLIIVCISITIFSGCTFNNIGIEGLLASPTISKEQSEIYEALTKSVGEEIQLKFPSSGDNRSAFIVKNIDSDYTDEAIVFYKKKSTSANETGLRINILDFVDDKWKSVYDSPALAEEIDKVIISTIGTTKETYIIVGYGTKAVIDKKFVIYRYSEGILYSVYDDNYRMLEVVDMDRDGLNEIVTISRSPLDKNFYAEVYKIFNSNGDDVLSVKLSADIASFSSIKSGKIHEDTNALYIDALKSDGSMITEVVGIVNNKLTNFIIDSEMSHKTVRPWGFDSYDLDKDGIIEIPSTRPFVGYENISNIKNMILQTQWKVVDEQGNVTTKFSSYYSKINSYVFIVPGSWDKLVTAKVNTGKNEVIFYKYDGDINDEMNELLRIMAIPHKNTQEYLDDGYEVLRTKGQIDYLYKLGESRDDSLAITKSMLEDNFIVLYGGY